MVGYGDNPVDLDRVVPFAQAALDAMGPEIVATLHAEDARWSRDEIKDPPALLCYLADTASELAGFGWSDPEEAAVYITAI